MSTSVPAFSIRVSTKLRSALPASVPTEVSSAVPTKISGSERCEAVFGSEDESGGSRV